MLKTEILTFGVEFFGVNGVFGEFESGDIDGKGGI